MPPIASKPARSAPPGPSIARSPPRRITAGGAATRWPWVFELESDATIPAEYVLMRHYLGEPTDARLEAKIAAYLRRIQGAHGGWSLFHDGDFDVSASVKAYFALKMIGDDISSRQICAGRARRSARTAARPASMSSRACFWLCSASSAGGRFRSCRSKSCYCRAGFLSTSTRSLIGRGR